MIKGNAWLFSQSDWHQGLDDLTYTDTYMDTDTDTGIGDTTPHF